MSSFTLREWIQQIETEIAGSEFHNHFFRKEIANGTVSGIKFEMIEKGIQKLEWLKELQRYKDIEEAGRLIELPCKNGDTVYDVVLCVDGKYHIKEMVVKAVRPYGAIRWVKGKDPKLWNVYLEGNYEYAYRHFYDFGRTVFLTKAEALAKLAELKGGAK